MSFHFLVPPEFSQHLQRLPDWRVGEDYPYWMGGRFNWSAQSYLVLRQYREGITIGLGPESGRINFAHSMCWRRLAERHGEFRVSASADYPNLFDAEFEVFQNPSRRATPRSAYLPYWPVPGVISRDPSRTRIETVAYAGRTGPRNLARELHSSSPFGNMRVAVIPPDQWHDMSKIDLLVAIRSFDRDDHKRKPPSKLFNAWLTGVPLIAGWDSAFSAIGKPGCDYLRVSSQEEFADAAVRLSEDREFYDSIVEAGRRRAPEVTHENIAQRWLEVLEGPVTKAFQRWCERGGLGGGWRRTLDQARSVASRAKARLAPRDEAPA